MALVPARSIGQSQTVLAITDQSRLEELPVDLLRLQGDSALIKVGALQGRQIVKERTPLLGAGILVRATNAGETGTASNGPRNGPPGGNGETVELSDAERAELVAFVESNQRMPSEAKERILQQLKSKEVPAGLVERLSERRGG